MALTDNLVSYYKMEDVTDSKGNNTLTNSNCTFGVGKINSAVITNGSSANLTTAVNINGDFTISMWYNPTALSIYQGLYNDWGVADKKNLFLYIYNDNSLQFNRGNGSTNQGTALTFTPSFSTLTWYHIAITQNGTSVIMYVNGISVASQTATYTGGITSQVSYIGSKQGGGDWSNGKIDEMGFWSRALTASEIATLYNDGEANAYPMLLASTRLNNFQKVKAGDGMWANIN